MNHDKIVLFQEAMRLEQARCLILSDLDQIGARLDTIHRQLVTESLNDVLEQPAHLRRMRPRRRERAPSLKAKVLEALAEAGPAGMRVEDLAATVGVDVAGLRAFFLLAEAYIPEIRKNSKGHYWLESESED